MSNRRKLKPPVGLDRYGQSYLDARKRRRLAIQLQQEHNRQGNARARELAEQAQERAASIGRRLESGELTPTEAQAELIANATEFLKR